MPTEQANPNDPLEFVRNMWGGMGFSLPGMVAPTFDVDELEKRITDLKAVEGWLRMNLSMLQMTIQGLEMQKATVTAVRAMGSMAAQQSTVPPDMAAAADQAASAGVAATGALSEAALWPWNMMQQMQERLQQEAEKAAPPAPPEAAKPAAPRKPRKA